MVFEFGAWRYNAEKSEIQCEGIVRELEPLIEKLLNYFISNSNKIISRQELIDHVWQHAYVDDNSINRAISELRKQLKLPDSNHIYIKTHYRKGYSLTYVPVEVQASTNTNQINTIKTNSTSATSDNVSNDNVTNDNTNHSASNNNTTNSIDEETTSKDSLSQDTQYSKDQDQDQDAQNNPETMNLGTAKLNIKAIATAILLLVVFYFVYALSNSADDVASSQAAGNYDVHQDNSIERDIEISSLPASWLIGAESRPIVSPDGSMFSYLNKSDEGTKSFVGSLVGNTNTQLEYKNFDIYVISWQVESSNLIAYVRDSKASTCHIGLFDASAFPVVDFVKNLMPCPLSPFYKMELDKLGQNLYYSRKGDNATDLLLWDIEAQQSRMFLSSNDLYKGIRQFGISPDGQKMFYLKEEHTKPTNVYIYDFQSKESKKVFEFPKFTILKNVNWYTDSNSLIWPSDSGLTTLDLDTGLTTHLNITNGEPINNLSPINKTQALTVSRAESKSSISIYDMALNLIEDRKFQADGQSFFPRFFNDQLMFVSNRSGAYQYWLAGEELSQITTYDKEYSRIIYPPRIANDGSFYLLQAEYELYLVEADTGVKRKIEYKDEHFINSSAIGPDKRKIYTVISVNEKTQVWEYDLISNNIKMLVPANAIHMLNDPSGNVYYTTGTRLVGLNTSVDLEIEADINIYHSLMSLSNRYFYVYDRKNAQLVRTELITGETSYIDMPQKIVGFAVNKDDTQIAITTATQTDTQINRTSWK